MPVRNTLPPAGTAVRTRNDVATTTSRPPDTIPSSPRLVDHNAYTGTAPGRVEVPVGTTPAAAGSGSPLLTRLGALDLRSPASLAAAAAAKPLLEGLDLETPAGQAALAVRLENTLAATLTDPATRARVEQQVAGVLVALSLKGQLEPVLQELAKTAAQSGALPPLSDDKRQELVQQLGGMVQAELVSRGLVPGATTRPFESWSTLSKTHLALVRDTDVPPKGPGSESALRNPAFVKELEALQGAAFLEGNAVEPLIDGPASFAARDRLIDGAEQSIHLMSWAFYDDDTGWQTARKLAAKAADGVEVRVIVDGQVASRSSHDDVIKWMEDNGIEVIRWRDADRPFDGQHRKVMVVDGRAAVAGGLNVGDAYSHRGSADKPKWRDTDVLVQGRAARSSEELFQRVWNQQVEQHNLPLDLLDMPTDPSRLSRGAARVAVVDHTPGADAHILLATLKAIEGATERVDIENAYFISTPALREALLAALERGVKVRILTNSQESVDEPIVSAPILASLPELIDAGAEVYLQQGDTLHAKVLVVDDVYSQVGSYNLHPRSHRYEGEMTMSTLDEPLARKLTSAFEQDIAAARRVEKSADVVIPKSAFTMIASQYFFDQL